MTIININTIPYKYDDLASTIHISERNVPFDTGYEVFNSKTGNRVQFKFTHSTGPEFDPNTKWVYESDNGIKLMVHNDKAITELNAQTYLAGKLRK